MCGTCGCSTSSRFVVTGLDERHPIGPVEDSRHHSHSIFEVGRHRHPSGSPLPHNHASESRSTDSVAVELEAKILAKNDALAAQNRKWLAERGILALNLMSSPGAGKTTLLERTIREFQSRVPLFVLEGDQATANDSERIRAAGAPVLQINTGTGCHLEAEMVARGLEALNPTGGSIVIVENVGNLVCPALFDLGEHRKIVILSVTEGEDKPLKYPHMFRAADLMIINKTDLLPHVEFNATSAIANARQVNPELKVLKVSARTGEGLAEWCGWILGELSRQSSDSSG